MRDRRDLRLRIWWDGDDAAAVDVTLASYFCLGGRGQRHAVTSAAINVGPVRGCSSAWAMPYELGARMELANTGDTAAEVVANKVTYEEHRPAEVAGYRFHARTVGDPADPGTGEFTLLQAPGAGLVVARPSSGRP